jgi:integrase/recombinase XerC
LGSEYGEAWRKLARLRAGESPPPRVTVSEAAREWLQTYIRAARNEAGMALAETRVSRYLEPALGMKLVARLTTDDLRGYRLWLEGRGLAQQTVAHILSDARRLLRWCEEARLTPRAPVPRRLLPKIQERPPDRLTEEELAALVSLPEPYGFVVRLAAGTGLRWAELCRAQARDVERGLLVVHQTKSGKVRRVPLSPGLLAELSQRVGRLVAFPEGNSMSFTRTARRLSGVERFHVHQLRHTFACQWLEHGGSLAALQQVLGHSTVVTTQRYARLDEEAVRREAEKVQSAAEVQQGTGRKPFAPAARARL